MKLFTIIAILSLSLLITTANAQLPDYKNKAVITHIGTCDNGATGVTRFEFDERHVLIVIKTLSGKTFYFDRDGSGEIFQERFYLQSSSEAVAAISHEDFDAALRREAPNYALNLHFKPSDCQMRTK